MDYQKKATDFAEKYGLTLKIGKPTYKKYFPSDQYERFVFPCTLQRNGEKYKFKFGQSSAKRSEEPTMYDILSCVQLYDVGSFEDFCDEFGYDYEFDRRKAEKIYKAVCEEYEAMLRLFPESEDEEVWQELNEIY